MDKHTYCFYTVTGEHLMFDAAKMEECGNTIMLFKFIEDQEPFAKLFRFELIGWEKIK